MVTEVRRLVWDSGPLQGTIPKVASKPPFMLPQGVHGRVSWILLMVATTVRRLSLMGATVSDVGTCPRGSDCSLVVASTVGGRPSGAVDGDTAEGHAEVGPGGDAVDVAVVG